MRDTDYATEIVTAAMALGDGNEAKIERISVKENREDEIRFSWWKDGRMMQRPLDLSERDLLELMREGIHATVFTDDFRAKLKDLL